MTDEHHPHPTTADQIRQYSRVGTDEALSQLGDPDLGDARSASATLELDTLTAKGPGHHPRRRRMTVGVTLSVANDGSCPPTPAPPCPPVPPVRPPRRWTSSRWPWLVVALLILLLIALGLNKLGQSDSTAVGVYSGTTSSTAADGTTGTDGTQHPSNSNATPSAIPVSPTALRLDDTVMPANTSVMGQSPDTTCDGAYHDLNQVPDFAIVHTQNWVRTAATQWQVRCVENLGGATVVALDSSHNVINRQVYGANYHFVEQLTFVQSTDTAGFRVVQVDFYAPFNTFLGRTIYRFDSTNRISDAYRQDGFQRPLQASHFTYDDKGSVASVTTEKTPRNGGGHERAYTKSDIEAATRVYYAYDSFN